MVLHSFRWPHAGHDVKVTGEFDHWSANTSMERSEEGHFVKVVDLPVNSKVLYKFVVDGHWCVDGEQPKEGSGAHENNYVHTGSAPEAASSSSAQGDLPVLGHGAAYVSTPATHTEATVQSVEHAGSSLSSTEKSSVSANETTSSFAPVEATRVPPTSAGSNAAASTTTTTTTTTDADMLHDNTIAEAYNNAVSHLPTSEELKHEVEHAAEVAGGFLAAGLAAGAAAFGLSNSTAHTGVHPITGLTSGAKATEASHLPTVESAQETSSKTSQSALVGQTAQTSSLEQTAVAAATSAATNAYNASGLSGLTGSGVPLDSLAKQGDAGFTGIGTAVNEHTGVVGTSKIVQGVNDERPTEETQTARLVSGTAGSLLAQHENGVKVERIGEHAVLAEVGIGGAAIGTAVVTDSTISSAKTLDIPAQAAEHLTESRETTAPANTFAAAAAPVATVPETTSVVDTSAAKVSKTAITEARDSVEDSGLAPALPRGAALDTPSTLTTGAVSAVTVTSTSTSLPTTSKETTGSTIASTPVTTSTVRPDTAASATNGNEDLATATTSKISSATTTGDKIASSKAETKSSPVVAQQASVASPQTPVVAQQTPLKASVPQAVPSKAATAASSPLTPSKAAAQAASKSGGMRTTLRSEVESPKAAAAAAAVPQTQTEEGGKKKKNILKRMKSIFSGSK